LVVRVLPRTPLTALHYISPTLSPDPLTGGRGLGVPLPTQNPTPFQLFGPQMAAPSLANPKNATD